MDLSKIIELVNIKSFSLNQNDEIITYLQKQFQPYSKEILLIKSPDSNKNNLIIGLNTMVKDTSAIILSGHIDTVIADEQAYKTNPYQATLINNNLYGLGVIDMKSYFACILNNIQMLSKLKYPIIITITCDEETSLCGITEITRVLKERNVKPVISLIGEPTNMNICSTSKSCYEYQIDIQGKSCHSSNPNNGINAIYITAKLISYIEELNNKYPLTTLSCGIVEGGEKVNIVPNFAKLQFDIRSNSKKYVTQVIEDIYKKIDDLQNKYNDSKITISQLLAIPALEKTNKKLIEDIKNNFLLKEKEFIGGCEAGYLQELGGDAFIFGVGDLNLAHKPNEFLNIKEFEIYNKLFCCIIKHIINLCNKS